MSKINVVSVSDLPSAEGSAGRTVVATSAVLLFGLEWDVSLISVVRCGRWPLTFIFL